MKLSARNVLSGTVSAVPEGQNAAHAKIALPGGAVLAASITNEAVDALDLKVRDEASAIVEASGVIGGKN